MLKRIVLACAFALFSVSTLSAQSVSAPAATDSDIVEQLSESIAARDTAAVNDIVNLLKQVSINTNDFSDFWASAISVIGILASIVTMASLGTIFFDLMRRRTSRGCQKLVIMDLIRHFMTNNAITEVLRSNLDTDSAYRPAEGALARFATLDSDVDLGRFSVKKRNYEDLHHLSLKIRNYNLLSNIADKHFQDPSFNSAELLKELNDLNKRAVDISERLLKLSEVLKIRIENKELRDYLVACIKDNLSSQKQDGITTYEFKILARNGSDPSDKKRCYYDKMGIAEEYNSLILYHSKRY